MGRFKREDVRGRVMRGLTRNIGTNTKVDKFEPQCVNRVLICRPNSRLGNQLLITPLLQEVESLFPNAKIDVFVRGFIAPILLENYSSVENIIRLPKKPFKELISYAKVWFSLRKHRYDFVINVDEGSSSGRMATQFVRAKVRFFNNVVDQELKDKYPDYEHMAKFSIYNLRKYLNSLGVPVSDNPIPKLNIKLTQEEYEKGANVLKNIVKNEKKTICIYTFATGAKCFSKEWWIPMYEKLVERYGDHFNIVEVLPVENVSQIDFKAPSYYSKDLREIPAFVGAAELFLGADCGIMHLVSTVDTPIVSLFSVTPINKYQPYNDGSIALDTNNVTMDDVLDTIDDVLSERKLIK